jgi:transcriptional regulator with XRE-family HTH domain
MTEPDPELIALGQAIRQVREERGMSAAELAAASVEQQYLETLEGGRIDSRYDVLLALDGFGV